MSATPLFLLEIVANGTILRAPFRSRRAAIRTLNAMKKKMGFRVPNEAELETHHLKTDVGESVIRMRDVISVSVVDAVAYRAAVAPLLGTEENGRPA